MTKRAMLFGSTPATVLDIAILMASCPEEFMNPDNKFNQLGRQARERGIESLGLNLKGIQGYTDLIAVQAAASLIGDYAAYDALTAWALSEMAGPRP